MNTHGDIFKGVEWIIKGDILCRPATPQEIILWNKVESLEEQLKKAKK